MDPGAVSVRTATAGSQPKRRKVTFSSDAGIDAQESIKLYLVSTPEEMSKNSSKVKQLAFNPEYLERFIGEDRKIYGYVFFDIDIWVNALSFHAHADIQFEKNSKALNDTRATDLKELVKKMFGNALIEDRDTFINGFATYQEDIKNLILKEGKLIKIGKMKPESDLLLDGNLDGLIFQDSAEEIVRFELSNPQFREWLSRLVPFVLLFVEGAEPIDLSDPRWEVYMKIKQDTCKEGGSIWRLLGFCIVYHFYHYPETTRLRISQILVFPPYQGQRHGLQLLQAVNQIAVETDLYDVAVEEPSEALQKLRDCMDVIRLISLPKFMPEIKLSVQKLLKAEPSGPKVPEKSDLRNLWLSARSLNEEVRKQLKINKKQFKRCWEMLIFLCMDPLGSHGKATYETFLMEQITSDVFNKATKTCASGKYIIDTSKDSENRPESFVMFCSGKSNGDNVVTSAQPIEDGTEASQEQLKAFLEARLQEITDIAEKVSHLCKIQQIPIL